MINIMHFWTWRTEEVKELLLWMKEYNEDKADEEKIHFIGVDCQYLTYQVELILESFTQANVTLTAESLAFLDEIDQIEDFTEYNYYSTISLEKKEEIDQKVDNLLVEVEGAKEELINASSEYDYQFIKRIALNIKQVNDFYYFYINEDIPNRDFYMEQNSLWAYNMSGEPTKVALWAHNGHIRNEYYGTFGAAGFYLKEELGEEYQVIAFGFSFGSFTAVREKNGYYYLATNYMTRNPKIGSINYLCHYAQAANFILREVDIPVNSSLDLWLSEPQPFLNIGSSFNENYYEYYYNPADWKEQYDILIYLDMTSAAEQLTT